MFVGIDLAALENKPSGFCILNRKIKTFLVYSDREILKKIERICPKVIAIDAPLTIPKKHYRKCDLLVRKKGIPIFSFNLPSLRKLAERAVRLKKKIKYPVIETYPYAVIKLDKKVSILARKKFKTKHERDAFICALVAKKFFEKKASCFCGEGKIYF